MPFANHSREPAIYYETIGKGQPLVFIPPPAMGHLTFRYQSALMNQYQVMTLDVRGDGHSGRSSSPMTITQLAHDVKRVLDAAGVRRAVVCGYSNGSMIAQEFALSYPERTAGLILFGGFSEVNSLLLEKEYKLGIWAAKNQLIPLFAKSLAISHFKDRQAAKEMELEVQRTDPQMLARQYEAGLHYRSTDRLQRIHVPLLLLYGANDHYVHHYQMPYRLMVKDVEVAYVSDCKHQLPTKRALECNAIIRSWLQRKRHHLFS
ncbi:alpha/beta fold hydrolase [Halalkalibacterium ligniniphilum]|uniref:alpha/beta fold hydrolase n=1 Tax=Halalkalibacterium ligniniphilum TaxID=1134413 RepID=UPI000347C018|nr:alpha/beta hydrolase [Halalkalibacterium ligniniphilum]